MTKTDALRKINSLWRRYDCPSSTKNEKRSSKRQAKYLMKKFGIKMSDVRPNKLVIWVKKLYHKREQMSYKFDIICDKIIKYGGIFILLSLVTILFAVVIYGSFWASWTLFLEVLEFKGVESMAKLFISILLFVAGLLFSAVGIKLLKIIYRDLRE